MSNKKNIIAYSLWGDNKLYWSGAVRNIELAKIYYPNFICRFYVDKECRNDLIDTLKGDNVEVILMNTLEYSSSSNPDRFNHIGLFWRFLPLGESDVDVVLSRDCDSRITKREVDAVNEWLESDKNFHIMRDHPYHAVPILMGMWGCRNNILNNIEKLIDHWDSHTDKGKYRADDQDFLGQIIYPIVKESTMEHSSFNLSYGNTIKDFPNNRENYEFVGDVIDENEQRHPDYWMIIKKIS